MKPIDRGFNRREYMIAADLIEVSSALEQLVKRERSEISLMLLAICHQKQGRLPEAVRLVNEAIVASPDRADLHSYLASLYQELGKPSDAEKHLQRAKLLSLKVPQPE